MLTGFIIFAGIAILILAHEAGHFFVAKFFRLKIDEFGFGFPPRIFAKKIGETEYSFNWLPIGGFVRIAGENDHMEHEGESSIPTERLFSNQSAFRRSVIILAGVVVNFLIGWALLSAIFMVGSPPVLTVVFADPQIHGEDGVTFGDVASNFSTLDALRRELLTPGDAFALRFFTADGEEKKIDVPRARGSVNETQALLIAEVLLDSPAALAGFKIGDVLTEFESTHEFVAFVDAHPNEQLMFQVRRGSELFSLPVVIAPDGAGGSFGALVAQGFFLPDTGVLLQEVSEPQQPFFHAIRNGFLRSIDLARATLVGFWQLVKSLVTRGELLHGVVGPVGIFSFAAQAHTLGLVYLFQLIALISVNLAVINLIPFPALDGGRFLFILIEKIKGTEIPRRVEVAINTAGFVLLILLMVAITARDVLQLLP